MILFTQNEAETLDFLLIIILKLRTFSKRILNISEKSYQQLASANLARRQNVRLTAPLGTDLLKEYKGRSPVREAHSPRGDLL